MFYGGADCKGEEFRTAMGWKLGIITDEISEDFELALDFLTDNSLDRCELRGLWGKNIMNLSPAQIDRAKQLIEVHRLKVTCIASPIFKYDLPEMPAYRKDPELFGASYSEGDSERLLRASFGLAKFFGTRQVRIFSYLRVKEPSEAYPYVRERLARAAKLASENDILLILENEHECNIGTGEELGRILRDVDSPSLRGNWDPGNAASHFRANSPIPAPGLWLPSRNSCPTQIPFT